MRCTSCDHLNPADARFCTSCGATLAITATMPLQPEPAVLAAPTTLAAPAAPAPTAPTPAAPALNQTINVTVQAPVTPPAPVVVLAQQATGPGCLVRALYFCFIGLWLGAFWTGLAWFLLVTIIGLPLGIMMLNRIPQVMTLKPVRTQTNVTIQGGVVVVGQGAISQQLF
jgi:hypothetical protein